METPHSFPERTQKASSKWQVMVLLISTGRWHFNNAPNFTFNTPLTTIKMLW
jgi:hypothetical protein